MTLPKAEDILNQFLSIDGVVTKSDMEKAMKEYARQVLEFTQERYYDADGSVTFRSIIDKIKDEL